jgi:D-alanyl-D-alanine carboxypeptidase
MEPSTDRISRRAVLTAGALGVAATATACIPRPFPGGGGHGGGGGPKVVLDRATVELLDELLLEGWQASGMPGVAAGAWIRGRSWTRRHGVADLTTGRPFRTDGHVRIASISKTFTGTAVLQLVDRGRLRLDDVLERFIPGIPHGDRITVRDLLAMQSGVWDFTSDEDLISRWDADPLIPWTPQDTVQLIRDHGEADFEPGARVAYCDSNYVLLGLIAEQASGRSIDRLINDGIVAKLGLRGTRFPTKQEVGIPDPHPTGYRPGPDGGSLPVGDMNPELAWTAGNMTSRLDDLRRWADELAAGRLLSRRLQRERLQGQRFTGQSIDYGYGLGVTTLNDIVGHNGAIIGFSSAAFRYPQADATFVVIGNRSTNFTTPTMDIFLRFVQALFPDQLR